MKILSAIFAMTLLSASTFASEIPNEKLDTYKEAAKLALSRIKLDCTTTPSGTKWKTNNSQLYQIINSADSAVLNDSGIQPVLTFNYYREHYMGQSTKITTSSDFLSIVSVEVVQYNLSNQEVNLGTLLNPNIVTQEVKSNYIFVSCKLAR